MPATERHEAPSIYNYRIAKDLVPLTAANKNIKIKIKTRINAFPKLLCTVRSDWYT